MNRLEFYNNVDIAIDWSKDLIEILEYLKWDVFD